MLAVLKKTAALLIALVAVGALAACGGLAGKAGNNRHNVPLPSSVTSKLASMGSSPGAPMMIRIYKESSELEVWKQVRSGEYRLLKAYEICRYSGVLGPKLQEGDRQAPEGFYTITAGMLNPNSSYYLSFNTGFPNKFDRAHGRTGSNLMIHGDCSSSGCYAMTDEQIAEIYALARETFAGGNASLQLQIYPFRMTTQNLARHASNANMSFWNNLKEGFDHTELSKRPPTWDVCGRRYVFNATATSGQPLDAVAACPALTADATLASRVAAKQQADAQAVATQVAALETRAAQDAAAAERAAAEQAAIRQRGQAIGNFVGGVFGGGSEQVEKTFDPSIKAPTPAPRIRRG